MLFDRYEEEPLEQAIAIRKSFTMPVIANGVRSVYYASDSVQRAIQRLTYTVERIQARIEKYGSTKREQRRRTRMRRQARKGTL